MAENYLELDLEEAGGFVGAVENVVEVVGVGAVEQDLDSQYICTVILLYVCEAYLNGGIRPNSGYQKAFIMTAVFCSNN